MRTSIKDPPPSITKQLTSSIAKIIITKRDISQNTTILRETFHQLWVQQKIMSPTVETSDENKVKNLKRDMV